MIDNEPPKNSTAFITLSIVIFLMLAFAQCATASEICTTDKYAGGKITFYNFEHFPDDWRFSVEEMIYASNHDKGKFGIEGNPKFNGDQVIFSNNERPIYVLTLNRNLFQCSKK